MDYNDQRRQDKSWNDPPMFSVEQINQAANTAPTSKRYRYPQPVQPAVNQPTYPNYPQGAVNSYGNYNNNASMAPAYQQPQQYPSYGNTSNAYGSSIQQPAMPQNYNYPSQPMNQYNPLTYTSQPVGVQSNQVIPSNDNTGYPPSSTTSMPSPYGTVTESNLVQPPSTIANNATQPVVFMNMNSVPIASMNQSAPAPGFNYNQSQQQYPYRQY